MSEDKHVLRFLRAVRDLGATHVEYNGIVVDFAPAEPAPKATPAFVPPLVDFEPPAEVNDPDEDMRTLALYSAR